MLEQLYAEQNAVRADIDRMLDELKARLLSDAYKTEHMRYNTGINYVKQKLAYKYNVRGEQPETAAEDLARRELARNYVIRGAAKFYLSEFEESLKDCQKALTINPNDALAYLGVAAYYNKKQDFKTALENLAKANWLDPESADVYQIRTYVYYNTKDYASALQNILKAVELDPLDSLNFEWLGLVHRITGRWEDAEKAFTRAVGLDPKRINCYYLRGEARYEQGKYAAALADMNHVLEVDPADSNAKIVQGNCYFNLKQYEAARTSHKEGHALRNTLDIPLSNVKKVPLWIVGVVALLLIPVIYFTQQLVLLHNNSRFATLDLEAGYYPHLAVWLVIAAGLVAVTDLKVASFKTLLRQIGIGFGTLIALASLLNLVEIIARRTPDIQLFLLAGGIAENQFKIVAKFFLLTLPFGIVMEFVFRGFLFTQFYLHFKGPQRWLSAMAVSQTYITGLFAVFVAPYVVTPRINVTQFVLLFFATCALLSWIYLISENIFLSASLNSLAGLHLLFLQESGSSAMIHVVIMIVAAWVVLVARQKQNTLIQLDEIGHGTYKLADSKDFTQKFITSLTVGAALLVIAVSLETIFKVEFFGLLLVMGVIAATWWYVPNEIRQLMARKAKQTEAN